MELNFKSTGLSMLASLVALVAMPPEQAFAQSANATSTSQQKTITVSGNVHDSNGPLVGAAVRQKGSSNGTVADLDGNFTLSVNENGVLEVSFMGYVTQEVNVAGQTRFDITLEEEALDINEVVVIGYGSARKSDVTGSIASVSGDALRELPSTDITAALQNRVAGVDIAQTSSKPGATMQIRIRGTRSLTASNDPLVVLDGIPFMGTLSDINPNDIKSMDILKDASSTAIYGSRGANGVIIITTKRGQKGQPAQVTYNGYAGVKNLFSQYPMMDGPKFTEMRKLAGIYTNTLYEDDKTNTNWQDLFYQTGMVNSHDIGITGSTFDSNYSFGAGYYHDKGVVPTQEYTRYSLRGSFDQAVGEYFRFGLTTNSNYNITKGGNIGNYEVLCMTPLAQPLDKDGNPQRVISLPSDDRFVVTKDVVESLKDIWVNEKTAMGTYNNLYAEVSAPWVKGLKYRINIGLNYNASKTGAFTGEGVNNTTADAPSSASLENTDRINWAVENLLSYDATFGKNVINFVGMYSAEQTTYHKSHVAGKNIPAEYFQYYNIGRAEGGQTVDPSLWDYQQSGLSSWMARLMYTFDNKYMLMATVRADGSSRLAEGHKWHTYPAISVGWNITRESFMSGADFVDNLKLRIGYGETSNQAINPYSTLGGLATRPYNFGDDYQTGYYVSSLPNTELGWEYSSTINLGLDFAFFGNRLSGTFEYYSQQTKDLLQNVSLPSTSGVSSYVGNVGETENKGVELTLNGTIVEKGDFTWDASFNLAANRNKITKLYGKEEFDEDGNLLPKRDEANWWFEGHPIDVIFDYEKIGLWQEGDPYLDILEPGGNVGMIKVKFDPKKGDVDASGKPTRAIGDKDRQIIDIEPKFTGGFSTRLAWKGLDLNIITAFKAGGKLISTLHSSTGYLNMLTGRRGQVDVDYWTPTNTGAKYPKPGGIISNDSPKYGSTLGYFDASYWKVRAITLGYNLSSINAVKDFGISNCRAYFTIQNPFVICSPYHKETGLDPETNTFGDDRSNIASPGNTPSRLLVIGTNSPSTRNFIFGLNIAF